MEEAKRVVLVEPGDVLLIGNVTDLDEETSAAIAKWAREIGLRIAVFPEAIDIDVLKAADGG